MVEKVEILAEFAKTLPRYCVNLWKKCDDPVSLTNDNILGDFCPEESYRDEAIFCSIQTKTEMDNIISFQFLFDYHLRNFTRKFD